MSRIRFMALALSAGALVAGCGGGDDDGDDAPMAAISAENTLTYSKEATLSLNGMAVAGDALSEVMGQFGTLSAGVSGPAAIGKLAKAAADETYACPGGGTVTVASSAGSSQTQSVRFVADHCVDDYGAMLHGELRVTIGPWDEFPGSATAFEMIMETGSGGLAGDDCEFNGGLVLRLFAQQSPDPYGENVFVFEYGTTDDGFISFCEPDQEIVIAANTLVRNELAYAHLESGGMTSSNTVSAAGGFEAPDGSGFVEVVAEDLEYGVTESGESEYGEAMSCPSSGHITLTGAGGSTASIHFGDDAPAGYAVQVIGPDGFVAEFATCEAFLSATG